MLAYSAASVASQPLVRKIGSAQVLFYRGISVVVLMAIACIPFYKDLNNLPMALFAFFLGIAGYIPVLAFMHGLRVSKVGVVAPIGATSALFTVVLAFIFLDTPLSAVQWFAIAMVVAANVIISVNPKDIRNSKITQLENGILFALIAAVGWGLFYFILVYPTRSIGPWLSALFVEIGVMTAAGAHLLLTKEKFDFKHTKSWPMVASGFAIAVGTVAYTIGVHSYNVGIVAVLSNSTALSSTLLAAYFFKERLTRFEMIVAAVMILGVILVSIQ